MFATTLVARSCGIFIEDLLKELSCVLLMLLFMSLRFKTLYLFTSVCVMLYSDIFVRNFFQTCQHIFVLKNGIITLYVVPIFADEITF